MTPLEAIAFDRALELARRGIGHTVPNPPVGAVLLRDEQIIGEGYHHRAGEPHAEALAQADAGNAAGATLVVTLEPCNVQGRTPPCAAMLVAAGLSRAIVGCLDPNPATHGAGVATLRAAGIAVDVLDDPRARELVALFAGALRNERTVVSLKMAMSLDGAIASRSGVAEWLTGEPARLYVRDLRVAHDAVMVGAGTIRVDDPRLTVRPARTRVRAYRRVVACETDTLSAAARVFVATEGYERTIVLAPRGAAERFANLRDVADLLLVGEEQSTRLDLSLAMRALREEHGVQTLLCEGGPTLAARLIEADLVDRGVWLIAPRFLANPQAVPVLAGASLAAATRCFRFENLERVGEDAVLTGVFADV